MLALCLILSALPAAVLAANEFPVVPITQEEPTQPTQPAQPVCVHSWADGVCAKCGAVCAHNWVDHVCAVCRDEQTSITRLGATLNYENRISVVTLFKLTGVDGVDLTKDAGVMVFTTAQYQSWDGKFNASRARAGLKYDAAKDCYYAESAPILSDDLHLTAYYVGYVKQADGSYLFTDAKSYGPTTYAYSMLDKSGDQKTKDLCVALLNYITAVQKYRRPATAAADLANAGLTEAQKTQTWTNPELATAPAVNAAVKGARDKDVFTATGKNIWFSYNVSMSAVYKISDDIVQNAKEAGTVFWTAEQYAKLKEHPKTGGFGEGTVVGLSRQTTGQWLSNSPEIAAKDIPETNIYYMGYLVMPDGTTKYTTVMSYNLEQYLGGKATNTNAFGNLCKALFFYERAADALFG